MSKIVEFIDQPWFVVVSVLYFFVFICHNYTSYIEYCLKDMDLSWYDELPTN